MRNMKAFNNQLTKLGSEAGIIGELAEFAAMHARTEERPNLDPALRLLARIGVLEHGDITPVPARDLPKVARHVKGYIGAIGHTSVKDGGLKRKNGELPEWMGFEEYVASKEKKGPKSTQFDPAKKVKGLLNTAQKTLESAQDAGVSAETLAELRGIVKTLEAAHIAVSNEASIARDAAAMQSVATTTVAEPAEAEAEAEAEA